MAGILAGTYSCVCGNTFEWKALKLEPGEVVTYWLDRVKTNAKIIDKKSNMYSIHIRCPKCGCNEVIMIEDI